jgi:hypothetical protein
MRVIHVLRKPVSESTVTANVVKHGTGALNIDASRISTDDNLNGGAYAANPTHRAGEDMWTRDRKGDTNCFRRGEEFAGAYQQPSGRWPANVILQHLDGCRCDGTRKVRCKNPTRADGTIRHGDNEVYGKRGGIPLSDTNYADKDGKESVDNWICEPGCPVARLDEQSGERKTTWIAPSHKNNRDGDFMGALNHPGHQGYNDTGGASRFYKQVGGKSDG